MSSVDQPTTMDNTATSTNQAGMGQQPATGGSGDMLDKGVDLAEREAGHPMSHSTTEKISDGIRSGYEKVTGDDIPIQDKTYS